MKDKCMSEEETLIQHLRLIDEQYFRSREPIIRRLVEIEQVRVSPRLTAYHSNDADKLKSMYFDKGE